MSNCPILSGRRDGLGRPAAASVIGSLAFDWLPAVAEAITLQELKDVSVETQSVYDATVRRAESDFKLQMTVVMRFKVDEEGQMRGEVKRTVSTPFGPRSRTNPMFARIGQPGDLPRGGSGSGCWMATNWCCCGRWSRAASRSRSTSRARAKR